MKNVKDYKGTLPYASELFGIYQPLLGWKSRLIAKRYDQARAGLYATMATRALQTERRAPTQLLERERALLANAGAQPVPPAPRPVDYLRTQEPHVSTTIDSGVARLIQRQLGDKPPHDWGSIVNEKRMAEALRELKDILTRDGALAGHPEVQQAVSAWLDSPGSALQAWQLPDFFAKEAKTAGYLIFLAQHSPAALQDLFFRTPKLALANDAVLVDPLLSFGQNNYDAVLSPIGIVHLYREYFFEFDSFLGPPVGHVWLSPGGTVELIEVNTRKVFTEQAFESMTETTQKSESEVVRNDEISDAVKEENRNDIKFGFTNTASYTTPVFQDTATASLSLDNAKMSAREKTTKQMRQQSEKLSSEIKRNFKTTFRTSTEVTDTTSKRYVIQNTTSRLVNYELRRKMRKVGVQVQDIGVQLCWHTFVDDPARELGIAKLIHVASPPDLHGLKEPDAIPMPEDEVKAPALNMTVQWPADDTTRDGFLPLGPPIALVPPKPGYIYSRADVRLLSGEPWLLRAFPARFDETETRFDHQAGMVPADAALIPTGDGAATERSVRAITVGVQTFDIRTEAEYEWNIEVTVVWKPSQKLLRDVQAQNQTQMATFTAEKKRLYTEALFKSAADRVKIASKVSARPAEVLREEERTVVYRNLITQLMKAGTSQTRHVASELVRSIFDIEKMLYFVAPEWWVPRLQNLHGSQQHLLEQPVPAIGRVKPPIGPEYVVDWGGASDHGRDNYYISEGSEPAKLGASLGWLIQLDGDNLRNTMLNSPWVKAVIPIRVGKEEAAINWLQQAHVEGSDGLDAAYVASVGDPVEIQSTPGHAVTVKEALDHLISEIQEFDRISRTAVIPNPGDPEDLSNHFAGSLPTEAVFEHGFYPLQGGVRFDQSGTEQALVSQWTEILPTDQVAALEVRYDPKTLQIITPADVQEGGGEDG